MKSSEIEEERISKFGPFLNILRISRVVSLDWVISTTFFILIKFQKEKIMGADCVLPPCGVFYHYA